MGELLQCHPVGEFMQPSPEDLPIVDIDHRWAPLPFLRDTRSRGRIEGDSEAVCGDRRIVRMSRLFLTFFCYSRGG
ncbi:MAG: hypothetical protein EBU59_05570 [Planctomycetia bacterium]|nr:hypothetical protein [Planctomycetia bacterium]